jgi:hypothetical protein
LNLRVAYFGQYPILPHGVSPSETFLSSMSIRRHSAIVLRCLA